MPAIIRSTNANPPVSATGLIDISFTDASINNGNPTTAFLQLTASVVAPAGAGDYTVTIDRLIFDDAVADGSTLGSVTTSTTYPEFSGGTVIPEPSGISIFALGAGGILAHRRRRRGDSR